MKNSNLKFQSLKLNVKELDEGNLLNTHGRHFTTTGTCLGECVKCGASCCLDAGHPGPHFCYLCK